LPLGVEGLEEWFDLELVEPLEAPQVFQRLQEELPDGLRLHSCRVVPMHGPSLSQELAGALWRFSLQPEDSPIRPMDQEWPEAHHWERALQALRGSDTWIWSDHDKKGRPRQRDRRPALRRIELTRHDAANQQVDLLLDTRIDVQGFGVRPEHVRGWLSGHLQLPLRLGQQERQALLLSPEAPC
ncbi:MAG: TIGR03936 family radical SAM-associated protein, partial [Cyanobium sp.]